MSLKVFYDSDIDFTPIEGLCVAVIGYGAQGRSHALNLRDSGINVVVGQRPGKSHDRAVNDRFEPVTVADAAQAADIVCLMVPDELHSQVYADEIEPHLESGDSILCCHGFSFLYEQVQPKAGIRSLLVAPKGAGHMVRTAYENGGGVPCYVAVGDDDNKSDWELALAYARAIGGGRVGVMKTTFAMETESDLFGEQAVLCGGVNHLAAAAFSILVDAGYPEEMAYFECVHELKLVVDLLYEGGIEHMREHISNTAEFGDITRGSRIVDDHVQSVMRDMLAEIQSGQFAREFIEASKSNELERWRKARKDSKIEDASKRVLRMIGGEE